MSADTTAAALDEHMLTTSRSLSRAYETIEGLAHCPEVDYTTETGTRFRRELTELRHSLLELGYLIDQTRTAVTDDPDPLARYRAVTSGPEYVEACDGLHTIASEATQTFLYYDLLPEDYYQETAAEAHDVMTTINHHINKAIYLIRDTRNIEGARA